MRGPVTGGAATVADGSALAGSAGAGSVEGAASAELEAHFQDEEANVVPDLQAHGAAELATRVLAEHAQMRALAARAEDHTAARALGELLAAHVEFEEASVFPTCERAEEEEDE